MHDLFPETLLVARSGEHIYTTSRKVAEYFGKLHKHVLRGTEKLIVELADPAFTEPNFGLSYYLDSTGRSLPEYHLSHDGFALLAMGFTGREALRWKVAFLAAFRQQEVELAAANARYLAAFDVMHPSVRPTVEDAQAGLPRTATAQRLGKSVGAVSYHRSRARGLGLLAVQRVARQGGAV